MDALRKRHDFFHSMGGRLSDHGLNHAYGEFADGARSRGDFRRARGGQAATPEEQRRFAAHMMLLFGRLDAEKGWTKQLHLGARRNNNTRRFQEIGPDTGFDSIGDWPQADALGNYLDRLDQENALPKMVVYNLNPADNYVIATMIGNFQDGKIAGQDPVRQRLVVPRPEGGDAVADECAVELRAALAIPGDADGFAVVHVVSAARVFPAGAVRHVRAGHGERARFRTTTSWSGR